ncbi:condensation domain protein [Mycobacterium xenopi 4042]|uniref:Condensation domain protein n=1 Tax=Mycobacterium xenopi 4042 TaxID=1299334 RepID=X8DBP2_MYCXE|nr:condensation domain protein [Mycobacterium xenopi 4042]
MYNLTGQPAFRAALIRIAEDRHRFVLTAHHIVMDGWSLPVVLRELFAGYYGSGCRHPRRIAALSLGWPIVTLTPRARRGVRCSTVSTTPRWWARPTGWAGGEAWPR